MLIINLIGNYFSIMFVFLHHNLVFDSVLFVSNKNRDVEGIQPSWINKI